MKRATLRFLQLWCACVLLLSIAVAALVSALGAALSAGDRETVFALMESLSPLPQLVGLAAVAVLGFFAAWLDAHYFVPIAMAAEATALVAHANSAQRLDPRGPVELRALLGAVNDLAQRHEAAIREIDARVIEAQDAMEAERNQLAVLLAELPQGVIVCNSEGVVLLYNEQARHLLCPPPSGRYIGLGRSVYSAVPGDMLQNAISRLIVSDACGDIAPLIEIIIPFPAEAPLRIRVAPVAGGRDNAHPGAHPAGFVLLIEVAERRGQAEGSALRTMAVDRPLRPSRPVFYDFDLFRQTPASEFIGNRRLVELAYTVLDTETTGLDPSAGDEIVAIGAVRIVNARVIPGEIFDCLIDPGRAIDPGASAVHGLTEETLRGQPRIGSVLPGFHTFCADTVLVGHNVAFDLRFLQMKEHATGVRFHHPVLDTLVLASILQEHSEDDRLEAIAHRYGIEVLARHTALGDALITAQVFLKMLPLLAGRGIVTLRQAQDASRRSKYANLRY